MRRRQGYAFWLLGLGTLWALATACGGGGGTASPDGGNAGKSGSAGQESGGSGGTDGGIIVIPDSSQDRGINADSACAVSQQTGTLLPLDLYFMLDTSGSMAPDMNNTIGYLISGVKSFCDNTQSAGLGAAAQEFPLGDPDNPSCNVSQYATPAIPWGTLPYPALDSWVSALQANGGTPTYAAVSGAVQACEAQVAANPTHKCAIILVTDGEPDSNCDPDGSAAQGPLGTLAANAAAQGIPIFAIGFPGITTLGTQILNTIATNAGTAPPTIITGNVGQAFIDALNAIRGSALGCQYAMPTSDSGTVDPLAVDVKYTPSDDSGVQLFPPLQSAASCDADGSSGDGWYYDDNNNPTKIILCPASCTKVQADQGGSITIVVDCQTRPPW